jgi:hypothetical protein
MIFEFEFNIKHYANKRIGCGIIKLLYLLIAVFMPIILFLFLRLALKIWIKNRDIAFKEYSYDALDILKRTRFNLKLFIIFLFPCLLIAFVNVLVCIHLFNCINNLECNINQIILSIIIDMILFVIQFVSYKKIVNYDEYDSICLKYNIVNEKKDFEIFSIIEILYFNFSFIIFLIDII